MLSPTRRFFSIGRARLNKSLPRDGKHVILRRYQCLRRICTTKVNFPQPPGSMMCPRMMYDVQYEYDQYVQCTV
jgi:hypothetical protein